MSSTAIPAPADTGFVTGTPVGVDVGRRNLLVLAPATDDPRVEEARIVDGDRLEERYAMLQQRGAAGGHVDAVLADRLLAGADDAAREALSYVETFEAPVMVLEDLGYPDRSLDACVAESAAPECWLYPALHQRLADQARRASIPVLTTSPKYTTRQCHVCDQFARVGTEVLTCPTDDCPVDDVCRDRSAAATIAKRGGR